MASKKSKILAMAFCAAVMTGIYANPVLARGEEDFNYQHNTTESGLNNPEIHHTQNEGWIRPDWEPVHPEGDVNCEEEVANSNITVGDLNKVTADLVANDETINDKVDKVASDVETLKGQVGQGDTDTHVKEGEYKADSNGNVTMDIVDKEGNDTGKDVVITDVASKTETDAAIADHQEQLDEHKGAIESLNGDVSGLIANDAVQDETLADHQEQLDEHKGAIESLNGEVSGLIANDAVQDETLADHQEQLDEHKGAIESLNGDVSGLIANDAVQDETLADHQEQLDEHKGAIESLNGEVSGLIANDAVQDEVLNRHEVSIMNHEAVIGAGTTEELKGAYSGTNYISGANNMVEADVILDREIGNVNSRVDGLENRVDGLEDRIDKVGAMAAAIANLRSMGYDPAAPTEVAVGIGQYRDETGAALGLFHYPNRDFMLSLSVSTSGDEVMGGIGATWKFGRKSPEKVAEIKKAQAEADVRRAEEAKLAKAEEMKKAAKEAKVQAQMERHAKLAAERAAQAEA